MHPIVTAVMLLYTTWSLHERKQTVADQAEREIRAYATALTLGIQCAVDDVERGNVQQVIGRCRRLVHRPQPRPSWQQPARRSASSF